METTHPTTTTDAPEATNSWWPLVFLMVPELAYLALVWQTGDHAHFGMSLLFMGAAAMMIRDHPTPEGIYSEWWEKLLGLLVLAASLYACWWFWQLHLDTTEKQPLRLLPLTLLAGTILLREGLGGFWYRWREMLALFFLGGPHLLLWWAGIPHFMATVSAKFVAFALWYGGLDVVSQGNLIALDGRSVNLIPECSGADIMTYMMGLAVLLMLMFPLRESRFIRILLLAAVIGFLTNAGRVTLLVMLNAWSDKASFDYWHTSEGSQIFGVIGMAVMFVLYFWISGRQQKQASS